MPNYSLRTINIVIGIILLIIGSLFVFVNFFSPHTVLIEVPNQDTRSLGSMDDFHFNGYPPETLQQSTDNIYRYLPAVNITNGQTLRVTWYSDIFLGVFIFSEEQFAYFQSILPNMKFPDTSGAVAWADENGITYEAVGWGRKSEIVSYNVTETGNYVAVITNAMYGAAYAYISDFNLDLISYNQTTQKQNDSLYLYIGVFLVILGITLLTLTLVKQKTLSVR
jgi:hypothetical protein